MKLNRAVRQVQDLRTNYSNGRAAR